jgi:uncharacterized protein YjdB
MVASVTTMVGTAHASRQFTVGYQAHVESIGWQPNFSCDGAMAGTEGRSLRMEALSLSRNVGSGWQRVCANAHLESIGWQGWRCGVDGVVVGTTGESRRMEAVMILITA